MRQSPPSSRWSRVVRAVRKLTARPVIETVPTLEVSPATTPAEGKAVETPSSRFAPDETTVPPVAVAPITQATVVTEVPPFMRPAPSRSSATPPSTTIASPRQTSRSRSSRQSGPTKVTVGDYSADMENTPLVLRERIARESYAIKSHELERAADERLAHEQQLVERRIRQQLAARQLELYSSLDEILDDTVILPKSIDNG